MSKEKANEPKSTTLRVEEGSEQWEQLQAVNAYLNSLTPGVSHSPQQALAFCIATTFGHTKSSVAKPSEPAELGQ